MSAAGEAGRHFPRRSPPLPAEAARAELRGSVQPPKRGWQLSPSVALYELGQQAEMSPVRGQTMVMTPWPLLRAVGLTHEEGGGLLPLGLLGSLSPPPALQAGDAPGVPRGAQCLSSPALAPSGHLPLARL